MTHPRVDFTHSNILSSLPLALSSLPLSLSLSVSLSHSDGILEMVSSSSDEEDDEEADEEADDGVRTVKKRRPTKTIEASPHKPLAIES